VPVDLLDCLIIRIAAIRPGDGADPMIRAQVRVCV
jgi:hypothetical protein